MKSFKELLEKKKPDFVIKIKNQKEARKAFDVLKKNKVKFSDESSDTFTFKKESEWDTAMELLMDVDIDFDLDG